MDDQDKKIQILKKIPFLKSFTEDEIKFLLDIAKWLKLGPGEILFKEGTVEMAFYIILKGHVSVQKKTGVGTLKKTLSTLNAGQCFGEMSFILAKPRSADIVANEETYILKIESETLNKGEEPQLRSIQYKIYKTFSEILAERLLEADRELARSF